MSINVNVKMLEILCNLIQEQNNQLIQAISTEENIDFRSLSQLVPSRYEIKKMLQSYRRVEKSNSTSESKLSSSTSPSEDE